MSEGSAAQPAIDANEEAAEIGVSPAPTCVALPGRCLREAREARGLSLADVASALKFGTRQIEALEADDYSSLKGATFVRGFVRSYARFLKLAPEPLLGLLDGGAPIARAEVRPPADTGVSMPIPGARSLSPWIAGATLLTLVAAGLLAWHLLSPEVPATATVRADSPTGVTKPGMNQDEVRAEVQAPVARIEHPPAAEVAMATAATLPATVPSVDGRQLVFMFSDKSWLEVRDGRQRLMLSGEFPGGDRQVATGKPPFYLWVGRASALRVLDGDREVDLKPHTRDEIARLTIE